METGSNDEMRDPLTGGGGGDDAASQSSQRSRGSLLERIRAQRNRDAAAAATSRQDYEGEEATSTPSTIQVPQYSQIPQEHSRESSMMESSGQAGSGSGFFSQAWNNISHSMETGMASLQQERSDLEARDALLPPTTNDEENYSMVGYFTTFVRDVYETFLNLPLLVRIVVVFALLYTAWKLI
ncbi:hypothetical protein ACA910_002723 [Epithemia clementina (nom. ined.)]